MKELHYKGQIGTSVKRAITPENIRLIYSPGVGQIVKEIIQEPSKALIYTNISNRVAVATNATALLGFGIVPPIASKPVMEVKCSLYKQIVDIDAFDLIFDCDWLEMARALLSLKNTFSGIHIEDVKSPECFFLFEFLNQEAKMPVMHDDRHATAVSILSVLLKENVDLKAAKIAIWGAGAAGIGIAELLKFHNSNIVMFDSKGPVKETNETFKKQFARKDACFSFIKEADVIIALAKPNSLPAELLEGCKPGTIIMPLSNPQPDVCPETILNKIESPKIFLGHPNEKFPWINNCTVYPYLMKFLLETRETVSDKLLVDFASNIK